MLLMWQAPQQVVLTQQLLILWLRLVMCLLAWLNPLTSTALVTVMDLLPGALPPALELRWKLGRGLLALVTILGLAALGMVMDLMALQPALALCLQLVTGLLALVALLVLAALAMMDLLALQPALNLRVQLPVVMDLLALVTLLELTALVTVMGLLALQSALDLMMVMGLLALVTLRETAAAAVMAPGLLALQPLLHGPAQVMGAMTPHRLVALAMAMGLLKPDCLLALVPLLMQ
jgi:hypothetical protein